MKGLLKTGMSPVYMKLYSTLRCCSYKLTYSMKGNLICFLWVDFVNEAKFHIWVNTAESKQQIQDDKRISKVNFIQ